MVQSTIIAKFQYPIPEDKMSLPRIASQLTTRRSVVASCSTASSSIPCSSSSSSSSQSRCSARLFSSSNRVLASERMVERQDIDDDDLDTLDDLDATEASRTDEIPTIGHLKLNRHRELLKYFRLAVHDFPNLSEFKQAYTPPAEDNILRFRSIHYQGEANTASRKSVLTVDLKDLFSSKYFKDGSNLQKRKFLHLCGTRWILPTDSSTEVKESYNLCGDYSKSTVPQVGYIKISCERFPLEAQNLKWCSDVFDQLLQESENTSDGIAEQPLDLRSNLIRRAKKNHSGGKHRASIADWPSQWSTPGSAVANKKPNSGAANKKQ
ncbi:unnamed protein product [Sympodiomycopsis kandeliae]